MFVTGAQREGGRLPTVDVLALKVHTLSVSRYVNTTGHWRADLAARNEAAATLHGIVFLKFPIAHLASDSRAAYDSGHGGDVGARPAQPRAFELTLEEGRAERVQHDDTAQT
jgi:hypothetical protein